MELYDRYLDYDVDIDPIAICLDCEKSEKRLSVAAYWMESILEQLYSNEPLDTKQFEDHLDECCHQLQISIPKKPIRINKL
jgi:hypothetical protein